MATEKGKCLKVKPMPRRDKSDEEGLDRALRILARIIARRHIQDLYPKDVSERG